MPSQNEVLKALLEGHRVCTNLTYGDAKCRSACVRTIEEVEMMLDITPGTTTNALAREMKHPWARGISGRRKKGRR